MSTIAVTNETPSVAEDHRIEWMRSLPTRVREDIWRAARRRTEPIEPMRPRDIADAVAYIVIHNRRVTVNEILICATEQTW